MTTAAALTAAMLTIAPSYQTRTGRVELHHVAVQLQAYAIGYRIAPELLAAVAMRESTFRQLAVSSFRAKDGTIGHSVGVMGVKTTAQTRDLFDLSTNVYAGAKLLAAAITRCQGDVPSALTAYARGPGKHAKNCKASKYSREVLAFYERLIAVTSVEGERGAATKANP